VTKFDHKTEFWTYPENIREQAWESTCRYYQIPEFFDIQTIDERELWEELAARARDLYQLQD
jgi:hypothetical protein